MTEPTLNSYKQLLTETRHILDKQKQAEILRGERFNVFSILKMTTREDRLHSRFICELLNPNGSHHKRRTFLNLFLTMLNSKQDKDEAESVKFHDEDAFDKVERELSIGPVDHERKTGGRIDVFLHDSISGATICIENKIYAGDQKTQIERYHNYNKEKNHVYYLTLNGTEPSKDSSGKLKCDKDFFRLSYAKDMVPWLEKCLKEVYDEPILRESIRQYLILIKKLTRTMGNEHKGELTSLIIDHLKETEYIVSLYENILPKLQKKFIEDFNKKLQQAINDSTDVGVYQTHSNERVDQKFSTIWMLAKKSLNPVLKFGVENFNGNKRAHWRGDLFIGVFPRDRTEVALKFGENEEKPNSSWIKAKRFLYNGEVVNLGSSKFLQILNQPESDEYDAFLNSLISDSIEYIASFEALLKKAQPEQYNLLQPQTTKS